MLLLHTILLAFTGIALGSDPFLGKYKIVPLEWSIQPTPGKGEYINVTGTVQQVIAQMTKLNPNFLSETKELYQKENQLHLPPLESNNNNNNIIIYGPRPTAPPMRDLDPLPLSHDCFTWPEANPSAIDEGIDYLNQVKGRPWLPKGFGTCARVSCSWDSGIFWCNDNDFTYELDSFKQIAGGAQIIHNYCKAWSEQQTRKYTPEDAYLTSGQTFFPNNWNVIVALVDSDHHC
ncbi:hypothetical protein QBC38DRAFT_530951 [Podospora fimiseda]|uniref:Secreted protein n=1 Tax=Podospora fimiseda TaxID=252190 RepID=A0AAN7BL78_9PEZI|nr:hypothetical protein QBC38DRAFT_530951 [Podospora fimiseda]